MNRVPERRKKHQAPLPSCPYHVHRKLEPGGTHREARTGMVRSGTECVCWIRRSVARPVHDGGGEHRADAPTLAGCRRIGDQPERAVAAALDRLGDALHGSRRLRDGMDRVPLRSSARRDHGRDSGGDDGGGDGRHRRRWRAGVVLAVGHRPDDSRGDVRWRDSREAGARAYVISGPCRSSACVIAQPSADASAAVLVICEGRAYWRGLARPMAGLMSTTR